MWTDANMQREQLQNGLAEAAPVSEMPGILKEPDCYGYSIPSEAAERPIPE
jgi:hypothetical protein